MSASLEKKRGRDLLLRGRGADIGVRAPQLVLRLCGASVALSIVLIAESLGIPAIIGINTPMLRFGALVVGALVAPTMFGGALWLLLGAGITLLMIVTLTPIVRPLVPVFVRSDPPSLDAQAVLVLSGGMNDEGLLQGQALDRLVSAMQLVRARAIPEVALSITDAIRKGRLVTTEADQRALVEMMAPPGTQLRVVRQVYSTRDEALTFVALARTHHWEKVVVVTSPLHSARACASLEHEGLQVECRPAAPRDYSLSRLDLAENRRKVFADVLYETSAWIWYRVRGWN